LIPERLLVRYIRVEKHNEGSQRGARKVGRAKNIKKSFLNPYQNFLEITKVWSTIQIPLGIIIGIKPWSISFMLPRTRLIGIDLINNLFLFEAPTLLDCMIPST
jgi:hypothetical protein